MDIDALTRSVPAVPVGAAELSAERNTGNREIIRAVAALNQSELLGDENELQFQRDPDTRRMTVQVVNRRTREVVSQIPPEYVLRLARELKRQEGV